MTDTRVSKPGRRSEYEKPFGPAVIEHLSADTGLAELGTYVMTFREETPSDPWTLQYEETAYVIAGRAQFQVSSGDSNYTVQADVDELVMLPKGSTVQYSASKGTRLLLSIAPVNWRDRLDR